MAPLAIVVSVDGLFQHVNPIACLFSHHVLLGHSEWHQHANTPQPFAAVLSLDDAPACSEYSLQIRHVKDFFWDENPALEMGLLLGAMCLVGQCCIKGEQLLSACASGQPLQLILTCGADRDASTHPLTTRVRICRAAPHEPWSLAVRSSMQHSVANFWFDTGNGTSMSTMRPARMTPSTKMHTSNGLRVTEHMLSCVVGYLVPLCLLRMLREDVKRCQSGICCESRIFRETSAKIDSGDFDDLGRLLASLSASGWGEYAAWLDQTIAQLAGAFQYEHGFKASSLKANVALDAMPNNLQLNVLDVHDPSAGQRAMHVTTSVGAFAAHSHGFQAGGAAEHEARLMQFLSSSLADWGAADQLSMPFAKRLAILSCHACATLAASFAASCQLCATTCDAAWFTQLLAVGYLVQFESLLTTRGDEWGMLQDVQIACRLLSAVRLTLREEATGVALPLASPLGATSAAARATATVMERSCGSRTSYDVGCGKDADQDLVASWCAAGREVWVRGTREQPILEFSARCLGFRDNGHASQMGFRPGRLLSVRPVLITQGINEDQSMANLVGTHTAEQVAINLLGVRALREYVHDCTATLASGGPMDAPGGVLAGGISNPSLSASEIDSKMASDMALETSLCHPIAQQDVVKQAAAKAAPADNEPQDVMSEDLDPTATGTPPFYFPKSGTPPRLPEPPKVLQARQRVLLNELGLLLRRPPEQKNIMLLKASAELVRLLGGGRVILCKSGKDRTSMAVTLEHGRLLHSVHGLAALRISETVQTMRRHGVRRENVRLNTSRRLYAFKYVDFVAYCIHLL